jgi:hypothetical protein
MFDQQPCGRTAMKILLLGDLSGVHQELSRGLRSAGNDVTIGHSRMANPGFESDIPFFRPPPGPMSLSARARSVMSHLFNAPRLTGFDIVQLITPKFFDWRLHRAMLGYLKRHNRRLVLINTSCTSDYHRRVADLAYSPCGHCKQFDLKSENCLYDRDDERRAELIAFTAADAIVATHYEYGYALQDTGFADKLVASRCRSTPGCTARPRCPMTAPSASGRLALASRAADSSSLRSTDLRRARSRSASKSSRPGGWRSTTI